jgi:hypothetical protein
MRKIFVIIVIAAFTIGLNAQEKKACHADSAKAKKETADTCKMKKELKEHKCTSECKDGKHVYVCGEKGHVCSDACKKAK